MPVARSYRAGCDQQRREVWGAGVSMVNLEEEVVMVIDDSDDEVVRVIEDSDDEVMRVLENSDDKVVRVLDDSDDEVQAIQGDLEEVEIVSLGSRVRRGRRGERVSVQSGRSPSPPVMELDQVG